MSHFAKIDKNNIVTEVIVAEQNYINSGVVGDSFNWVQTSYNNNFKKNYAGIGDTYDATRNAFIKSKSYPSYVLNESTCRWEAPVAHPGDGVEYEWNEKNQSWDVNEAAKLAENPFADDPAYEWNEKDRVWDKVE